MLFMRPILALVAALLLAGCETFGHAAMTPDQIAAAAKDKNAAISCGTYDSLTTDVSLTRVNVDKDVPRYGEIKVECGPHTITYRSIP